MTNIPKKHPLLTLKNICYSTKTVTNNEIDILKDINMKIMPHKFTGIIGKSGSGKTTLLKIIANLLEPTSGTINNYRKKTLKVSIAFQDYALLPWLNTYENIELGIDGINISPDEKSIRVSEIIALMGLNGFEDSYPKELSSGMKQRVNLARSLIVEPDILLLDEPFSNLDPLTTETLKSDLIALWQQKLININSIVIVTHNTNDIIDLCHEVYTLGKHPAEIIDHLHLDYEFPRQKNTPTYNKFTDDIFESLSKDIESSLDLAYVKHDYEKYLDIANVSTNAVMGLMNYLVKIRKLQSIDIQSIIENTNMSSDALLPILELAKIIDFIKITDTKISATTFGRIFVTNTKKRSSILSRNLEKHIGLVSTIKENYPNNMESVFNKLSQHISVSETNDIINTLVSWMKYAKMI